jgi:hypothetical protein
LNTISTLTRPRILFLHNELGLRQLKETLSNLLIGSIFSSGDIWLVSPWISDFDLLDNRSGDWSSLEPGWGTRMVKFSELLILLIESGRRLHLVTNYDKINDAFIERLEVAMIASSSLRVVKSDKLHTKGLLSPSYFLAGSMNFTYSGTHINQEQVQLNADADSIMEAKLEFEVLYGDFDNA